MKNKTLKFLALFLITAFFFGIKNYRPHEIKFKLGNEVLLDEHIGELKGKRIAVVTNQTGILANGLHIIDEFVSKDISVAKIFTPEHGIRGDENYSNVDEKTGIPIISLYGDKHKPSKKDLQDVDLIIYDIQDVGARFYTYTSTLNYIIESAIENNITMYVCDRPVILNPDYVDGFILQPQFESFVGKIPSPVCYGMTCGELAAFLAEELYMNKDNVRVAKMQGYSRKLDYDSLGLKWEKPSPNMFTANTAVCYPATCFLEGTNVSEGRGTGKPFEYFGAPWVDSQLLAGELNAIGLSGVEFVPLTFTPSEKISAYPPKYFNQSCNGIYIKVTDKNKFEPVKCGAAILVVFYRLFKQFRFDSNNYIDKLAGTDTLRKMVTSGKSYEEITSSWKDDLKYFNELRKKYLFYN